MVHHKSEVDFSTSNLSTEYNVAAETAFFETELSNYPVGTMMDEVGSEEIVVGNDEGNEYERILAEDDGKDEEYASEEEGDTNAYEENGADEEGNHDEFAAEEDDGDDGDNYDYYDDGDDDVDEDDNDGIDDNVDVDEDDDLMEEDTDVEHKETDIYEDEENKERTTEGESEKGDNGEGDGNLEPKVKKLGKKNGRNEVVKMDLGKVTYKSEEKSERDEEKGPLVEEDEENAKEEIKEKGEGSAQEKVKKLRKRNRRKFTTEKSEKVASKQDKKLKSSHRKKTSKKVESMGMIFMCSSETKKDCYRYKVLGLPASKRDIVGKIYKGMRLFLYDFDLKLMYGIYKAAGPGGYNIEPKAFKSQFPSQVCFTVLDDCIPLAEEKFKKVIKENYFTRTKFDCQLTSEQVKRLCKLFVAASKGPRSIRLDRGLKERTHASVKRDRPRARAVDEDRRSFLDEKRQYDDYPRIRRREVIASPLAPPSRFTPLHLPAAAPSYAYDRTVETDTYRRSVLVDHHDSYRQPVLESRDAYRREPYIQPHLGSRDAYRREPLLEHHDVHWPVHRDSYRRQPLLELNDVYKPILRDSYRRDVELKVRHRDEIAGDDPYILYRKRQSYQDPVSIEHVLPERDRYHISPEHERYHPRGLRYKYQSRESPVPEYQSRESPVPEYRSSQARYRY